MFEALKHGNGFLLRFFLLSGTVRVRMLVYDVLEEGVGRRAGGHQLGAKPAASREVGQFNVKLIGRASFLSLLTFRWSTADQRGGLLVDGSSDTHQEPRC